MRALLLALLFAPGTADAVLWVAPDGKDTAPGTEAEPFATPARAREAARAIISQGLRGNLTIRLRGGTYRLDGPLVLGREDGGTEAHAVTWEAAPGERVVLSGGDAVTGWAKGPGEAWAAELPEVKSGRWHFRQLFVNGERRPRARGPNEGYYRVQAAGPDDRTSFTFRAGEIAAWNRPGDAEVVFLHDWSVSRVRVASVDESARSVRLADPIGSAGHAFFRISGFEKNPRYYVENALELLDRPGEWYLDRGEGRLHYRPLPGEDVSKLEVIAPRAEALLEVKGERGKPVRHLRFVGLTFAHVEWPLPERGCAEVQASFFESRGDRKGRAYPTPAARFEHAEGCSVERCRFEHLGGVGLWLGRGCRGNKATRCEVRDVGANGVMIGETGREDVATGNELSNSLIERCGTVLHGAVGVWVGLTDGTVISRNDLVDLPYTGVSVGWIWNPSPSPCRANRVEGNHIRRVMQVLSDGGGIYTLGRQAGSALVGNLIHDVPLNAGRAESNGIFMDEGSTDIRVEGNVIYDIARAPIRFHRAGANVIRKNVLVAPPGREPFAFNSCKKDPMTFEGNEHPDPASWKPPAPGGLPAGRER